MIHIRALAGQDVSTRVAQELDKALLLLTIDRKMHSKWIESIFGGCGGASWGKLFYLQFELFCLQLSFFAYSPFGCLLDALSHCK